MLLIGLPPPTVEVLMLWIATCHFTYEAGIPRMLWDQLHFTWNKSYSITKA